MPLLFNGYGDTSVLQMKVLLQLLDELLRNALAMTYHRSEFFILGAIWSVVSVPISLSPFHD